VHDADGVAFDPGEARRPLEHRAVSVSPRSTRAPGLSELVVARQLADRPNESWSAKLDQSWSASPTFDVDRDRSRSLRHYATMESTDDRARPRTTGDRRRSVPRVGFGLPALTVTAVGDRKSVV